MLKHKNISKTRLVRHMQNTQYSEIPKLQAKTLQRKEASINKKIGNNKSPQFYSQYFVVSSILQIFIHVKFQI